jgi:hypothetical protein
MRRRLCDTQSPFKIWLTSELKAGHVKKWGQKEREKRRPHRDRWSVSCIEYVCTYRDAKAHTTAQPNENVATGWLHRHTVGCQIPRKYRNCVKAGKRITSSLSSNKAQCFAIRRCVRQRGNEKKYEKLPNRIIVLPLWRRDKNPWGRRARPEE